MKYPLKTILLLGVVLPVFLASRLSADEITPDALAVEDMNSDGVDAGDVIDMITGDIESLPVNSLSRVSVTNPDIADISDAQSDKVSLLAKKAGQTVLFLWDASGKRSVKIRVVNENLAVVKARLLKILNEANITGLSMEENYDIGKVVITGDISKDDKSRMDFVLQSESGNVLDLVKEEKSEDLIQVDMQIIEISTSLEKNLGILWGQTSTSTGTTGGTGTTNTNSGQVSLGYNENLPGGDKFADLFKVGNFQRTTPLQATVNALVQEGKARLISKPRLVVVSGKQASFLVGGEIPIETTTTNTTGSTLTQNTTYTQYGVNLTITPTLRAGKIDVVMNVDIRDIDSSNSSNGNVAFITRTAQTDLFMDNKQTIALAGLIKYADSEQVTKVPFLGDVPILGALFRNRQTPSPDTNTEMVIILTPTVVTTKKYADTQVVMPTPLERKSWNEIEAKYEHEPLGPSPSTQVMIRQAPADSNGQNAALQMPLTSTTSSQISPEMLSYARMVQERISQAIRYPQSDDTPEGTVRLRLHILKDGSLDSEEIIESSGSDILDQDAVQAAKTAAPFGSFLRGMDEGDMVFTIPIVYKKLISS